MEIYTVPIGELKPAEYNPRKASKEQFEALQQSIRAYGLVDPIIVNSNAARHNVVIGGHFRLRVAESLGMKEVPVVYVDIPDIRKEQELNLRLNKNTGEWDFNMLANLEKDLLEQVGFSEKDISFLDGSALEKKDTDTLEKTLGTYLDGSIKQIVILMSNEQYDTVIPRLQEIMDTENLSSHSEVFFTLLDAYENKRDSS